MDKNKVPRFLAHHLLISIHYFGADRKGDLCQARANAFGQWELM